MSAHLPDYRRPQSSGGCGNVNRSLRTALVEIFQGKEFDEKFQCSSPTRKEFLWLVLEAYNAVPEQALELLTTRRESIGRKNLRISS